MSISEEYSRNARLIHVPTLSQNPLPPQPILPSSSLPSELNSSFPIPHLFPTTDMTDQSESSRLQVLFDAALQDYQNQTGITLAKHPLAEQLQNCHSVESVTNVLREQTQAFDEFQEKDKVLKPLKKAVSLLQKLSATASFGQDVGLNFPPVTAINTGLGVLLSAVQGMTDSYDSLVELLESIESFLARLDIYTKITPTVAMTEIIVKILVELLSTLALVTKQIKQGKSKKLAKKLFGGENGVEAVLQRIDRLTQEEARITAAQTLEVVHGLIQNMRVVLDDGKASADHVMEALKIMQDLASAQNKSKRDRLQNDILKWLSPPDPWKNHHIACKSRHRGSAAWFVQGDTYSEWKTSEASVSSLWIHGKPGAGKSVFCSTIIGDILAMRKAGLASLAFFYCDFREKEKTGLRGLLSSLLAQLCHQSDPYYDTLSKFYSEHAEGSSSPSDDELVGCLKDLLNLPGLAPVYVIIDALDECSNTSAIPSSRDEVLNLLDMLIKSESHNLRICVTSRPEADIKDALDVLIPRHVSLHDEGGQKRDIDDYIKSVISTHKKNKYWKAEHKKLVIDVLTKKANGMFRWVECQVVYICGCIPARIKHALTELPDTLDETYERTLRDINKADWEFAHRLFHFVAVASRPLRVEELAELLAVDFTAGSIPIFHEGWRVDDPVGAVLSTCSSLLAIVDGGSLPETEDDVSPSKRADSEDSSEFEDDFGLYGRIPSDSFNEAFFPEGAEDGYRFGKVIQFSHYSVKEFLTSPRLAEATDIIPRRYHVSLRSAHTLAAQACLGILLHLHEDVVTTDNLGNWPLAQYAARHWVHHAQFEDVSQSVEDGMKEFFDPNKPHLGICLWICNPDSDLLLQMGEAESPLTPRGTPLHYAALWGFESIVEFLIIKHSQGVNSRNFADDTPPLFVALIRGHVKAARILIEHGADVTFQVEDNIPLLNMVSNTGPVEIARMLIEHGADVTAHSKVGVTALHVASARGQVEIARMLIERGADFTAKDDNEDTPLRLATRGGQVEVIRMLADYGADVTAQNENGEVLLLLALQEGQVEVARFLIERGADVTAKDNDGGTPLHLASRGGRVDFVRMLFERGADVTAQNENGETPLHLALQEDQVVVAHMLIERGADLAAKDNDGWTAIHLASQGEVEVARMVIECGVDVTAKTNDGKTALHLASRRGRVDVVRMLIERGADVTAKDNDGETPLHLASRGGRLDIVRMLFERGADVTANDNDGETPLHMALQGGEVEVFRVLIERGADVTSKDKAGKTPLHLASLVWDVEVARMLIDRGADLEAKDNGGESPLHLASREGRVEVARMLIDHGADVTAKDNDGNTPLHLASREGQVEAVPMLIELGANVTSQNENGDTPLHLASTQSRYWAPEDYARVLDILIKHGADVNSRNTDGLTPVRLAQRGEYASEEEVKRILLEHGADPGDISVSESPPVTSPARSPAGLLPIPSHSSVTTPCVANTDLPQTPTPFSQPPSNDDPHRPSVFFNRRFLYSLGIVSIAIALPFFIRSVPLLSRKR